MKNVLFMNEDKVNVDGVDSRLFPQVIFEKLKCITWIPEIKQMKNLSNLWMYSSI